MWQNLEFWRILDSLLYISREPGYLTRVRKVNKNKGSQYE